jgi:hypothetical protein
MVLKRQIYLYNKRYLQKVQELEHFLKVSSATLGIINVHLDRQNIEGYVKKIANYGEQDSYDSIEKELSNMEEQALIAGKILERYYSLLHQ